MANTCQYWVSEPAQCSYWRSNRCTNKEADHYPNCNNIGTRIDCRQYSGSGVSYRCVLPDTTRVPINRRSGAKWFISEINGYNNGLCDGHGTTTTCSGYSPYHMAFSKLTPSSESGYTTEPLLGDGLDYRLPIYFEMSNLRAELSKCYWWNGVPSLFSIDTSGNISISESKCDNTDTNTEIYRSTSPFFDTKLGMYVAPCNGCKPECPHYTGVCWEYCIDSKMKDGDKILAEQVLELRYRMRGRNWDEDTYMSSFPDPYIFAWTGTTGSIHQTRGSDGVDNWVIESVRTYITDFNAFEIGYKNEPLSAGTPDNYYKGSYVSLVRELKSLSLKPLIRNQFDTYFDEASKSDINIFEVGSLTHEDISIFGDTFWSSGYCFAINFSDPDLLLIRSYVKDIFEYNDMLDIYSEKGASDYTSFYSRLENVLSIIMTYYPDKVFYTRSGFTGRSHSFFIDTKTFFGDNQIFVFDSGSGAWQYDKISVKKFFMGGVIAQTAFNITGDGKCIDELPYYELDFSADSNDNGYIDFKFLPFRHMKSITPPSVYYVYDDTVQKYIAPNPYSPPTNDTWGISYSLYAVDVFDNLELSTEEGSLIFFGNAGYCLAVLPDESKALHHTHRPWELTGALTLTVLDVNGDTYEVPMEVYNGSTTNYNGIIGHASSISDIDKIEVNQIILKPINITNFIRPCSASLTISKVTVYEKRSFLEVPEGAYTKLDWYPYESFIQEDDIVVEKNSLRLSANNNYDTFRLTKFGSNGITIGVVFRGGLSGRIKGAVKTKMITWVRQPYCRDVEIYYKWSAWYEHYKLNPEHRCVYELRSDPTVLGRVAQSYIPPCGDHSFSRVSANIGPMWYPYTDCSDYDRYNITGHLTEYDTRIMEVFKGADGSWNTDHGRWDIRMLGPADNYGNTCDVHSTLWACNCDWSFCNKEKKSAENIFTGWGRARTAIDTEDYLLMIMDGGDPPKFGNPYRDFIRSFRSIDSVQYYYLSISEDGLSYVRRQKWMPMPYAFSSSDITSQNSGYLFYSYSSEDYSEGNKTDISSFYHPFSVLRAKFDMEGVSINEATAIDNDGAPVRYAFDDVFRCFGSAASIIYPLNSPSYTYGTSPYRGWYTYKDYPVDPSKSIQWVWQEIQEPVERGSLDVGNILEFLSAGSSADGDLPLCNSSYRSSISVDTCVAMPPYSMSSCDQTAEGTHVFLDLLYPDYLYDARLQEHRLMYEEGSYSVYVYPPTFTVKDGIINEFFFTQLGDGPYRAFDINGTWDPVNSASFNPVDDGDNLYYDLYTTCTVSPWAVDDNNESMVTLFGDGYTDPSISQAITDGRVSVTYDDMGEEVKTYYQRGIYADLGDLSLFPVKEVGLEMSQYEVNFHTTPASVAYPVSVGSYDPAMRDYNAVFEVGTIGAGTTIDIDFRISRSSGDDTVASAIGAASMLECVFSYGAITRSNELASSGKIKWAGDLYHIPSIEIYVDGVLKSSCSGMSLASHKNIGISEKHCFYDFSTTVDDIFYTKRTEAVYRKNRINGSRISDESMSTIVTLRMRIAPTNDEILGMGTNFENYYGYCDHKVKINSIYLYHKDFMAAVESVTIHERKYYVSYGHHGDFPPHGTDSTVSLLQIPNSEYSTLYQQDNRSGVIGMSNSKGTDGSFIESMNKIRGRVMGYCYEDKEIFDGTLEDLEDWQTGIYGKLMEQGATTFTLASECPPGLIDYLYSAGVYWPEWECTFTNTYVASKLQPVAHYPQYSPAGHLFVYGKPDISLSTRCYMPATGDAPSGLHYREDVFEYKFVNPVLDGVDGSTGWSQTSVLIAYYQGVGKSIIDPMSLVSPEASKALALINKRVASERAAALCGVTTMSLPISIDPMIY